MYLTDDISPLIELIHIYLAFMAVVAGIVIVTIVSLIARAVLRLLANCDERDDSYSDPDPKPVRRRAF